MNRSSAALSAQQALPENSRRSVSLRAHLAALFGTARIELVQALRSPTFWALQVVLLITALLVMVGEGAGATYLRYASKQLRTFVAFQWLLLLLLAWPALRRAAGRRGDVMFAAPISSMAHGVGTLLGILAWLVPAAYLHLGVRWVLGEALGGQANWTLLTTAPPLALSSSLLALGLAACLSLLLPRLLPALLVWLGIWVFLLMRAGGPFGGFVGPYLPFFDLLNVYFEGTMLSPAIGLGLMRALVVSFAWQTAAVGVLLLALWLFLLPLLDARRAERSPAGRYAGLVLAGVVLLWTNHGYRAEVASQQPPQTPAVAEVDAWRVLVSRSEVHFEPAAKRTPLRGTHTLEVAPSDNIWPAVLVLRVNPGLDVTPTVAGERLPAQRRGDSVVVDISGVIAGSARVGAASATDAKPPHLTLEVAFEGAPTWPYSDHRFRQSSAFPNIDSSQPITSLALNGVGYLLRDGDWLPWPWSGHPQLAEKTHSVSIRTVTRVSDTTATFGQDVPQLLAIAPPEHALREGVGVFVGRDPGAGLARALRNMAAQAARAWTALGESNAPRLVAMPYLPDAYANAGTVAIPEAYDLVNSRDLAGAYQAAPDPLLAERAALQLLARAWLNGFARQPRGYARAVRFRDMARWGPDTRSRSFAEPPPPEGERLVQYVKIGPIGISTWPAYWLGEDPSPYEVTPFALWLGMELADEGVRDSDTTLLRGLSGKNQEIFALRDRQLPALMLARNPDTVRLVLALAEWTDAVGAQRALAIFTDAYRGSHDQRQATLVARLGLEGSSR